MLEKIIMLLIISTISLPINASIVAYDSRSTLMHGIIGTLTHQDWSAYETNTILDGTIVDGVLYSSTSSETLVVGSPHGASWLLGYSRGSGRYASMSTEVISFEFLDNISVFGISLSQGNSSRGGGYTGYSLWEVSVDGVSQFTARTDYVNSDFTGEAYLGLNGLNEANLIEIKRVYSDANIVWDIRSIDYKVSAVPPPAAFWLYGGALIGLIGEKHRKKNFKSN